MTRRILRCRSCNREVLLAPKWDPDEVPSRTGLASRFRTTVHFPDYSDSQLVEIFARLAEAADYQATLPRLEALLTQLAGVERGEQFGNGRWARNALDGAVERQAWRLRDVEVPSVQQMRELVAEDVQEGP